ncbi:MAG: hypothetical protein KY455_12490 [Euryarchaeota archaeon]|nr:hypothetical protein [Euryarchaeota archaeon]
MQTTVILDGQATQGWVRLERRRRLAELVLALAAVTYLSLLVGARLGTEMLLLGGYVLIAGAGLHQFSWERRQLGILAEGLPHLAVPARRMAAWEHGSLVFLVSILLIYGLHATGLVALDRVLLVLGLMVLAWFLVTLVRSTSVTRLLEAIDWRPGELVPSGSSVVAPFVMPLVFVIGTGLFLLLTPGEPGLVETLATLAFGAAVIGGLSAFRKHRVALVSAAPRSWEVYGSDAFLWGWEHASYTFALVTFSIVLGIRRSVEPHGGPLTLAWLFVTIAWAVITWLLVLHHRRRLVAVSPGVVWDDAPVVEWDAPVGSPDR